MWCGAVSTRGCPWPSNTPSMVPAPPTSWIPCCWAMAFSTLEWAWARRTWKLLISTTPFLLLLMNNPPGESTAAVIPSLPLKTDADSSPFFHAASMELFTPTPTSALPLLQELPELDVSCATGEVTLRYCTGEGGSVSASVASALLALACVSGITPVARRDDPFLLYGGTRDDHLVSGLLFCSG